MKDLLLTLFHLAVVTAKLCGPGGVRAVIAVHRKYDRLFSASPCPKKPGPTGPSEALIQAIVELKSRNPRFGCPRIARIIFQVYYNAARSHASLGGHTPLTFASGHTIARAELNNVHWVSHCRDLVQLPEAA